MLEHISSLVSTFLLGKAVLPRARSEHSFRPRSAPGLSIANRRADSRSAWTGCPLKLGLYERVTAAHELLKFTAAFRITHKGDKGLSELAPSVLDG